MLRAAKAVVLACLVVVTLLAPSPAHAGDSDTVSWNPAWRRVGAAEAAAVLALGAADFAMDQRIPYPQQPSWRGGILFDDWARGTFRASSPGVQSAASTTSDWLYKGGIFVPFLLDDYFGALALHQNADLAVQLFAVDAEAYVVAAFLSLSAEHVVGRARPYTEDCSARDASGALLHACGTTDQARSFFSGHATATATTAGVICAEHQHLALFGGGAADLAPCLVMIGVSVTAGMLRLVNDEHWASDVIVGWSVGALAGYLLPTALHYGFGGRPPGEIVVGDMRMSPTLIPYQQGAGAGFVGVF
jgi:hypothetical protein